MRPTTDRPSPFAIAVLTALIALGSAPMAAADDEGRVEVERTEQVFFPGGATMLEADLSFGDVRVEGARQRNVEAQMVIYCSRDDLEACRERAAQVSLETRVGRKTFEVSLARTPRVRLLGIHAELLLRVPRDMPLEVDLRAGKVEVSGMRSDVEVDVGAGDVEIRHEQEQVGRVKVDVGVGEVNLWVDDSRIQGSGFPRSVDWSGRGEARVEVDMGTGDVDVKLE